MKTLLLMFLTAVFAASLRANEGDLITARQQLDGLRGIQPTKEKARTAEMNKRMDAAWTFLRAHKDTLAVVEEELTKAMVAKETDQFFLLDMAYLLITAKGDEAVGRAVSALERLDPQSAVILANREELFHFVMKLGALGKETDRYLAQMDRIYLRSKVELYFFREPHVVQLDAADLRCMVYGVAGDAAARHLAGIMQTVAGADQLEIIRLLEATGSEANVPEVKAVMDAAGDYDTITAGISFMMQMGGPAGKAAVQVLDPRKMDAKARAYFEKINPSVAEVSFKALVSALAKLDKSSASDRKLQELLDKMEEHNGADDETPTAAVAKSGLPTAELLAQLKRIRARSFRRETNHVFEDLPIFNLLINALQFKPAKN